MRFSEFIRKMLESQSGVSSKRVCGVIGWLFVIGWITYLCITGKQAPDIAEIFLFCIMGLLGLDTIPKSIWMFRKDKRQCDSKNIKEKNNG